MEEPVGWRNFFGSSREWVRFVRHVIVINVVPFFFCFRICSSSYRGLPKPPNTVSEKSVEISTCLYRLDVGVGKPRKSPGGWETWLVRQLK